MNIGALVASLGVDSTGLWEAEREMERFEKSVQGRVNRINRDLDKVGKQMKSIGSSMTKYLTLPLVAVGTGAFMMAKDFESSMSKIEGLVGIARDQVDAWGKDILEMAPRLGKAPKELADALFFVTSAGIRGAAAMDVLEMSAKASAAGLGETKVVADLVTSAINAYGVENMNATQATDILVAAVREGKAEASELAGSMGQVLPIAAELGVTFDQVGAAQAAMTRTGTNAATAATQLRAIMVSLMKPTNQAEDALQRMGSSSAELRRQMREQGLISTLGTLREMIGKNEEGMAQVFPNVRALAGVLDLMGSNAEDNIAIFDALTKATGALDNAYEAAEQTIQQKWNVALTTAQTALTELGMEMKDTFIPALESISKMIQRVVDWFRGLDDTQKQLVIRIGMAAAALGPLTFALGFMATNVLPGLISMTVGATRAMNALRLAMMKNPATALAVGVLALGAAIYTLTRRTKDQVDAQDELNKVMDQFSGSSQRVYGDIRQQFRQLGDMNQRQVGEFQQSVQQAVQHEENTILEYERLISKQGDRQLEFARLWIDKREQAFDLWDQIGEAYAQGAVQEGVRLERARNELIKEIEQLEQAMTGDTLRIVMDTDDRSLSQAQDRLAQLRKILEQTESQMESFETATGGATKTVSQELTDLVNQLKKEFRDIDKIGAVMGDSFDPLETKIRTLESALQSALQIEGVDVSNQIVADMVIQLSELEEQARQLEGLRVTQDLQDDLEHFRKMQAALGDSFDQTGNSIRAYESAIETLIKLFPEGSAEAIRLKNELQLLRSEMEKMNQGQQIEHAMDGLNKQIALIEFRSQLEGNAFDANQAKASVYHQTIMSIAGIDMNAAQLAELIPMWEELNGQAWEFYEGLTRIQEMVVGELSNSFVQLGQSIGDAYSQGVTGAKLMEVAYQSMTSTILRLASQIIQMYFAEALAGMIKGEASKGLIGLATAAVGIGALSAMWESNVRNNMPRANKGALVYGDTLIRAGDYASSAVNPEVVTPLDKLKGMLQDSQPKMDWDFAMLSIAVARGMKMVETPVSGAGQRTVIERDSRGIESALFGLRASRDDNDIRIFGKLENESIMLSNEMAQDKKRLIE